MSTQKNNPQEMESKVTETQHRWSERLHSHRQIKTLTGERTQHYTPDRTGASGQVLDPDELRLFRESVSADQNTTWRNMWKLYMWWCSGWVIINWLHMFWWWRMTQTPYRHRPEPTTPLSTWSEHADPILTHAAFVWNDITDSELSVLCRWNKT